MQAEKQFNLKTLVIDSQNEKYGLVDFTCDGIAGSAWASKCEDRRGEGWRITFGGLDGSWREVHVRGEITLRTAIRRALPYALPLPTVVNGHFGSFVKA